MTKLDKTALLSSLGAGLEYYDFIVYAFLAQYIGKLFFPDETYILSLLAAFAVFSAGYVFRPLGGLIFGMLGDKYGRKNVFLISIILMAVSTFLMGVVPGYQSIGIAGTLIFVVLRLVQGIAFGAEMPGATTFISEHSKKDRRGINCAIMICFVTLGVMLGSSLIYLISTIFDNSQMLQFGWRIPFLIGGLLAFVAFLIRRDTRESPYFLKKSGIENKNPLYLLFAENFKSLLICCLVMVLPSTLVMLVLVMPTYFHYIYQIDQQDVYLAISIGYGWSIITALVFGFISDYIRRKRIYVGTSIIFLLSCYFLFYLLNSGSFLSLLIFMFIYQSFISLLTISFYPLLAENFPTEVRFTGIAFSYNIIYALTSLVPLLVTFITKKTGSPLSVIVFLTIVTIISFPAGLFIKDLTGKDMAN